MSRKKASSAAAPQVQVVVEEPDEDHEEDHESDKKGVSGFISKIFKMVSDPGTQDIVCWNERGDGFIVKNEFVFASQIMRSYFRHQNFSSFVRQLNFYGFRKRTVNPSELSANDKRIAPSSLTSFYHPSFRKGHPELLGQIQRKSTETKDAGLRDLVTQLQGEVSDLRQQNEDLFKIQQRILYIFSRYMRASQGQVGSGGNNAVTSNSSSGGSGNVGGDVGSGSKRLRGSNRVPDDGGMNASSASSSNKRQRLLIENKPDTPPQGGNYNAYYQHSNANNYEEEDDNNNINNNYSNQMSSSSSSNNNRRNYSNAPVKTNADYFQSGPSRGHGTAGGSHGNDGVLDVNTADSYSDPNQAYGSHQFSDMNWSSDPVQAINDLIQKSGGTLQQVLNTTPMSMQMGRAGGMSGSTNAMNAAANGLPYVVDNSYGSGGDSYHGNVPLLNGRVAPRGPSNSSSRGVAVGSNAMSRTGDSNAFIDLANQVGTNPKQLLELLDRMSGEDSGGAGMDSSNSNRVSSGGGNRRAPAPRGKSGSMRDMTDAPISGVFEDGDDLAVEAVRSSGARNAIVPTPRNTSAAAASNMTNLPQSNISPAPSRAVRRTSGNVKMEEFQSKPGGATLSPMEDESPAFPLKPDLSPLLTSMPLPTSPVSPFIGDASIAAGLDPALGIAPHTPTALNSFADLRSPNLPMPMLQSSLSTGSIPDPNPLSRVVSDPTLRDPFLAANSPFHAPMANSDLAPLTPNPLLM